MYVFNMPVSLGGLSDWMLKNYSKFMLLYKLNINMTANICTMKTIFLLFNQHEFSLKHSSNANANEQMQIHPT